MLASLSACETTSGGLSPSQVFAPDPLLQEAGQGSPKLPGDFPAEIPLYPNAVLSQVLPLSGLSEPIAGQGGSSALPTGGLTRWNTADSEQAVRSFYLGQFQDGGWQLLSTSSDATIVARRQSLLVTITLQNSSTPRATDSTSDTPNTEFVLEYSQAPSTSASLGDSTTGESSMGDSATATKPSLSPTLGATTSNRPPTASQYSAQVFTDLDALPPILRKAVEDLAALGVLSSRAATPSSSTPANQSPTPPSDSTSETAFKPNEPITRREYARWLVTVNNRFYTDRPAQQLRLGNSASSPAFQDVPTNDPDFAVIQGLAEAGIIASSLTSQGASLFRPDAPLTREQMLLWKVPLDTRQALPAANIEAVKQTWGFQDINQLDPLASRAVLADFQNGDLSNIRRVYGYTTLLQPKKAVTRAEAAASLWYFGSQTEGISAEQILRLERSKS